MNLPIALYPENETILRSKTLDITEDELLSTSVQELISNMIETMYAAEGIGIAAPQVHKDLNICIIGKEADPSLTDDLVLVNPSWNRTSKKKQADFEGCLSIPKTYGRVTRWQNISVNSLDRDGNPQTFEAHNFFARVIQHEVDHLHGILFIDKALDIHTAEKHP